METKQPHEPSVLATWVIILLIVAGILGQGLFTFTMVGDRGQPSWDYRPIPDVPGQSPYAVYPLSPGGQHVRGKGGL